MKNQAFPRRNPQSGSAIIMIFVFIALFVAVSLVITQSFRGGGASISTEKAKVAAADVMNFGNSYKNAIKSLRVNDCTDTQINLINTKDGSYTANSNAPSDKHCNLFETTSNGIALDPPSADWLDTTQSAKPGYGRVIITGMTSVPGVGTDCAGGGTTCSELILFVPFIRREVCQSINNSLWQNGVSTAPPLDAGNIDATRFTGTYTNNQDIHDTGNVLNGKIAGCFEGNTQFTNYGGAGSNLAPATGTFHYFMVLQAR